RCSKLDACTTLPYPCPHSLLSFLRSFNSAIFHPLFPGESHCGFAHTENPHKEVPMPSRAPHNPPFRADHVGSLLRLPQLKDACWQRAAGKSSDVALREVEDTLIRCAVAQQEEAGFRSITDGEFRCEDFYTDFYVRGLGGVEVRMESSAAYFVDHKGRKIPVPWTQIVSRLQWRKPIYADHFKFLRSLTKYTPKVTVPSPIILHFTCGSVAICKNAYPDMDLFWSDIADAYQQEMNSLYAAGCRYLQVDDPPMA